MVIVYLLRSDREAKGVSARSHAIFESYDALFKEGKLGEELENCEVMLGEPDEYTKGKDMDFYSGITSGGFSASEEICEKMELSRCPDVSLIPFILKDNGKRYFYLALNNVIDVRDKSECEFKLPVASKPNSMFNIDPKHPKLNRTMLFTMPWADPKFSHKTISTTFYVSVSEKPFEYDFLKMYLSLNLTGINPIELCRY